MLADSPIEIEVLPDVNEAVFQEIITSETEKHQQRKIAIAFVKDLNGKTLSLTARAHAVEGFSMHDPEEALTLLTPVGKYSFIQEPVNRMMMSIARYGHALQTDYFYCSQVPTSREQVNMVGANIKNICIGNTQKSRDCHGFTAMEQLRSTKIISYS